MDGSKLTSLALRLGVLGVLKKELGHVEQISFLPVRSEARSKVSHHRQDGLTDLAMLSCRNKSLKGRSLRSEIASRFS